MRIEMIPNCQYHLFKLIFSVFMYFVTLTIAIKKKNDIFNNSSSYLLLVTNPVIEYLLSLLVRDFH